MALIIIIDGESEKGMFAAGPTDIRNHFLPKIGVRPKDVQSITFSEPDPDYPDKTWVHPDNYTRKEQK
jgi:hypothetical protein